ncbi:MAG: histidine kinase, partial [Planctomycetaceae bacterium]|nr:histidine kinase [Planctomycetaceae bacterium]
GSDVLGNEGPIRWEQMTQTGRIREMIADVVPGFEAIREIDQTKKEFQIAGRTFHKPQFATPSGKAKLHRHPVENMQRDTQLQLMTVRSEGQFNTVVYEDYDLYRGVDRRDVILLHPEDIAQYGLKHNQAVTISSEVGSLAGILVYEFPGIKPGNALMYYPEANELVPRTRDPRSQTPAFKGIPITIQA